MKATIVRELGQPDILLPSLVAEGLAANDRIWAAATSSRAGPKLNWPRFQAGNSRTR